MSSDPASGASSGPASSPDSGPGSGPVVVLIGPPGAGKSTVAAALGRLLHLPVRDTDADVEAAAGMPVSDIFIEHGEPAFRELERAAVARALAEHAGVLALGGGAVLDPATQQAVRGHRVVFLDVGIADASARIGFARSRPLLVGNPRAQWLRLMAERRPVYERLATLSVLTDGHSPEQVARLVLAGLGLTAAPDAGAGPHRPDREPTG